jgi:hypothetical protein
MKFKKTMTAIAFLLSTLAVGAEKEGGGGILISAEFATLGRKGISMLAWGDKTIDTRSIFSKIKDTRVIPVEKYCRTEPVSGTEFCEDGHFDASHNVVLFAYKKWDSMTCLEKLVLSSHELLRAAGLEGEDYSYSGRFISGRFTSDAKYDDQIAREVWVQCELYDRRKSEVRVTEYK